MTIERIGSPGTASAAESTEPSRPGSPYVQLWIFTFDELSGPFGELQSRTSPDERQRAERYRSENDHRRFILARGQLRSLMEAYTGRAAATLSFAYGPRGRPRLQLLGNDPDLRFSVAHSATRVAYAFALGADIGVDLEPPVAPDDLMGRPSVYRGLLTPSEVRRVEDLPASQRAGAALRSWVRKEACLKALGSGLSVAPNSLDVWGDPTSGRDSATLVAAPDGAQLWLEDFTAGDHVGAIAVRSAQPARVDRLHGPSLVSADHRAAGPGGRRPLADPR